MFTHVITVARTKPQAHRFFDQTGEREAIMWPLREQDEADLDNGDAFEFDTYYVDKDRTQMIDQFVGMLIEANPTASVYVSEIQRVAQAEKPVVTFKSVSQKGTLPL